MSAGGQTGAARSGIALTEEAFHLVRSAPASCLVAYYFGSIPFVLALLYFWAQMSYSADAYYHCAPGALLVAMAFVWMKAWQTVYARGLLAYVREEPAPRWTFSRIMKMTAAQGMVHAFGFIALLPSVGIVFLILPLLFVYGFLQNATILGDGEHRGFRELFHSAWYHARCWPGQSFFIVWLLSPVLVVTGLVLYLVLMPVITLTVPEAWTDVYGMLLQLPLLVLCPLGFAVTINLEIIVALVPELGRMFLGIQSTSLQTGLMYDSTLMSAVIGGMTYLLMDPLVKAAFVLRCFYVESLETGADLRVALRRAVRTASIALLVGLALFGGGGSALAQESPAPEAAPAASPSVNEEDLDRAITETLEREIYRWRQPRVRPEDFDTDEAPSALHQWLEDFFRWIGEGVKKAWQAIEDFIRWLFPDSAPDVSRSFGWLGGAQFMLTVLLVTLFAALVVFLVVLVFRWRRTREEEEAEAVAAEVDIEDENISADDLPESGWLAMARELLDKNEPRLALRAMFLAGLALLGRTNFVRIAKGKSNREYQRELARRAHATPGLVENFSDGMHVFESVWYGTHAIGHTDVLQFEQRQNQLRRYVEPE